MYITATLLSPVEFPPLPPPTERLAQLAEIERKGEEKKEVLARELEKTEQLLTSTYDRQDLVAPVI